MLDLIALRVRLLLTEMQRCYNINQNCIEFGLYEIASIISVKEHAGLVR